MTTPTWSESMPPATGGSVPPTEIRPGAATAPPDAARPAEPAPSSTRAVTTAAAAVGRHWGLLATLGVLSILGGLALLAWPEETVLVIAVIIGIQLMVNGVVRIVQSFAADDAGGGDRVLIALVGIVSILVGVLCLRNILQTVAAIAILVGAFLLIAGIVDLIGGLMPGAVPARGWRLLSGALGVVAGVVVLAYPGISLAVLVAVLGIWLLLYGALLIGMSFAVRRDFARSGAG